MAKKIEQECAATLDGLRCTEEKDHVGLHIARGGETLIYAIWPGDETTLPATPGLRDYFAAKAMAGIVGSIDSEENYQRLRGHAAAAGLGGVSEWIARDAYKQADAMLKARR